MALLDKNNDLVIAFCGTRGLPANHGGFETTVDEVTKRFVANGYDCEVFCRWSSYDTMLESHEGRRLVYVAGSNSRKMDTFVSSIQTGLHLLRHRKQYAHVVWFNNANFPGIMMTLLARIPTTVNTDGLEWRRAKWSFPFKAYYFISSFLISRFCENLVSDSIAIQSYYQKRFFKKTNFIPYGAPAIKPVDQRKKESVLQKYGLKEGQYFLQITRFEPDNLPLETVTGFKNSGLWEEGFKMVLVGYKDDTPYARKIKALAGKYGIEVLNATYDPEVLSVLRESCFCYVHGNTAGGTNPALLEALASCPRIMAVDVLFSREVLGDVGLLFDPNDIASGFKSTLLLKDQSSTMRSYVSQKYQWDEVANSYMRLAEGKPAGYLRLKGSSLEEAA